MPVSKLSDAPANIRELDGAKLTLAQVNWILDRYDELEDKEDGIKNAMAVAIAEFKEAFEKVDGKWKKKEEEESKAMETIEVDGQEVTLDELKAAWKAGQEEEAESEREKQHEEEGKSLAIKMLREEDNGVVVGGIMCLYSDADHKDLQEEYFTPETKTWHEVYKSVPALFHHGLDDTIGLEVIGHRIAAEVKDEGLWVEDWLDKSNKFWALVKPLLEAKALFYSPGSVPHLVRVEDDGHLLNYPVAEDTLTVLPAQHRTRPIEQIKAAYKSAGLNLPEGLEPEPGEGGGVAGATRLKAAKARAEATLLTIRTLEEV